MTQELVAELKSALTLLVALTGGRGDQACQTAIASTLEDAVKVQRDMTAPEKYWVVRARPESKARLEKVLSSSPLSLDSRTVEACAEIADRFASDLREGIGEKSYAAVDIAAAIRSLTSGGANHG